MSILTIVAIVVVQGILAYRFQVFRYFDLPLIYCVYYGFTLNRPVASVFIGSVSGTLAGQPVGGSPGNKRLQQGPDLFCRRLHQPEIQRGSGNYPSFCTIFIYPCGWSPRYYSWADDGNWEWAGARLADLALSGVFNTLLGLIMFGFRDRYQTCGVKN